MAETLDRLRTAIADRYVIKREIGSGGMAIVYLADDVKHHRQVALKMLRPELAAILGADRFLKEIEVTANLQHPNILPLYDSGEADTFLYYVMPFLEGESLQDKLNREKQIGVEEAVEISRSVAAALDYAHQHEVIHRDIKPANILLQSGQALVADFGIALAVSEAGGKRLTETGLSLGTPHYMSPEQATGDRTLDARSDVYSLGCVTYEMLAGEPPHIGNSVQAIIAKILSDTPTPITRSRELVPPNIDAALQKALSKSPADRFSSAAKFADALANPGFTLPTTGVTVAARAPATERWRRIALGAVGVSALMALAALWGWIRPQADVPVSYQKISLWAGQPTMWDIGADAAIAPDGSAIAFTDTLQNERRLFIKERDQLTAGPIATTINASGPFFSPDGDWIGFWMDGQIKKMPRSGGATATVADSADRIEPAGAWLDDGTIIFSRGEQLMRVGAEGGDPTPASDQTVPGVWYLSPLPNARGVLYAMCTGECDRPEIGILDLNDGVARHLFEDAISGAYLETGHVIYVRPDGGIFATLFDLNTLEPHGVTTKIGEGVATLGPSTVFTLTQQGTLLYLSGPQIAQGGLAEAVWVQSDGTTSIVDPNWTFSPAQESGLAISPDGSMVAMGIGDGNSIDVWIKHLPDGPFSRLTFADSINDRPRWTADGSRVSYIARGDGYCTIMSRTADGSSPAVALLEGRNACLAQLSPDERWIVYREDGPPNERGNIFAIQSNVGGEPIALAATEFHETSPELSPNGRWLAYESDESGQREIYLRPFPNVADGKWLVSTAGGAMPFWSRDGRELFYNNALGQLVAAQIGTGPPVRISNRVLFDMARQFAGVVNDRAGIRLVDVTPDGRFLAIRGAGASHIDESVDIVLVENWLSELRASLPR